VRGPHAERYPAEHILSLAQLLDLVPLAVPLILELKDPRFAERAAAERLVAALGERIAAQTVVIIAFKLSWVEAVQAVEPAIHTGHISLFNPLPTGPTQLVGPYWRLLQLNPWYVRLAHRRGKWVCPLDPDLHRHLARYLALGVDAVLTNDPAETRRRVAELGGRGG
jgi:glycerophosphoryl diester phosphodiesterase